MEIVQVAKESAHYCGCKNKKQNQLFSFLSSKESGFDFLNNIDETKFKGGALNEFGYMGGGVGILDVNNDGLVTNEFVQKTI